MASMQTLLFLASLRIYVPAAAAQERKPNIPVIMSDDVGMGRCSHLLLPAEMVRPVWSPTIVGEVLGAAKNFECQEWAERRLSGGEVMSSRAYYSVASAAP